MTPSTEMIYSTGKMKKNLKFSLNLVILAVICAAFVYGLVYMYQHNSFFHSLFNTNNSAVLGESDGVQPTLAQRAEQAGLLSVYIYAGILALQLCSLYAGVTILRGIRRSLDTVKQKLKKLENAEIFLDLPLYIGLFGTVSSFVVLTYSPTSGRLIAYSSTLVGIIFSVIMRVGLLYPLRSRLLDEQGETEEK